MGFRAVSIKRQLLFGIVNDSVVFLPERKATELSHLRAVLGFAETWGELRTMLPRATVREIRERYMEGQDERKVASAPFDSEKVWGFVDGDWPDWPQQLMLDFIPQEIIEKYGSVEDSVFNGPFLKLRPEKLEHILAALKANGFKAKLDTGTIEIASGYNN